MKATRAVVRGKSREIDLGIVFNRVTARGGGKDGARRRCRAVALALALQSLLLCGVLPARAIACAAETINRTVWPVLHDDVALEFL